MPNFAFFKGSDDAEISQKQGCIFLLNSRSALQRNVMGTAFDDGDGGNQSQLGISLQVGDVGNTHVHMVDLTLYMEASTLSCREPA